ncbi:MAG: oligosaccharide flippase family protein [Thermoanaerobaculia bacterium]
MAVLVVTARTLGPAGRGAIAAVTTWTGLFVTFGHLSLGQIAIHQASKGREDWLPPTASALLVACGAVTILGWALAAVMYACSGAFAGLAPLWIIVGFIALPFQVWEQYGSSLLMALERVDLYNRMQVIARTTGIILLVALLAAGYGVTGALVAIAAAQVLVSFAGARTICKQMPRRFPWRVDAFRELLGGGIRLHLNAVGFFLITSTDVLILNHFRGNAATGEYQLATQLTFALLVVPQAAAAVLFGTVARQGKTGGWPYQRRVLVVLTSLMIVAAVACAVAAPLMIRIVAGRDFLPAVPVFRILLISLIGMTVATLMGPQWIARGLFLQLSGIMMVFGVANVAASFLLTPRYGMYAPAWTSAITYSILGVIGVALAIRCDAEARSARHEPER